jgi:hypothetical protein
MTDDKIALGDLLETGSDASFLREMIGFAAQRLMELEVGEVTGANHGERSPERLVQRNGYRVRDWQTRVGNAGAAHSKAAPRVLLPRIPRAAADRREGANGGDPGSLSARHLHSLGGPPDALDRHGGDQPPPGQPPVR